MCSRPACCSRASRARALAYPINTGAWRSFSRSTISAIGNVAGIDTPRAGASRRGRAEPGRVHRCRGRDDGDHELGRIVEQAANPRDRTAHHRCREADVLGDRLHEDAALARAPARCEAHVLVEQEARCVRRRGQVRVDRGERHASVGHHLVEARHHLGLRHHRECAQVVGLDPVEVDPTQSPRVERRPRHSVGEQRAHALALQVPEPVAVAPDALDAGGQLRVHLGPDALSQGVEGRGHRHRSSSGRAVSTCVSSSGDAAASQRLRVGRQLEVDAGGAREQQLGHEAGWARRSLAGRGVDVGEAVGDLDQRALVRVDVALVQLGIARSRAPGTR